MVSRRFSSYQSFLKMFKKLCARRSLAGSVCFLRRTKVCAKCSWNRPNAWLENVWGLLQLGVSNLRSFCSLRPTNINTTQSLRSKNRILTFWPKWVVNSVLLRIKYILLTLTRPLADIREYLKTFQILREHSITLENVLEYSKSFYNILEPSRILENIR